ncbi:MAG TPA: glycosyltransferase family 4 protein [Thermodesulforhabdus norvegica]|uniref:Glycosyltransferase family 4 protein n=1 Tax=Thermodesulforhabdus norvegica TaxID=39841 RepID=A0A7C0WVS7_9BACT|nr:glycosyltransferase family 4 protein [Deltaproteobacteria bacterium]MBW2069208.1 glycosyltransferase family 4 protein [Deltaproteobacteria bacterium]HDL90670.1 glycosyltransferase family 4 protein [Thermodesulforhabdus norvegica]
MRIAIVSIPYKPTPPRGYGGIERVVYELVEELVRRGHDVTLFATPGSYCSGRTVEVPDYDPSKAPSGITGGMSWISEEPLYRSMKEYLSDNPVDVIHDWSFENTFVRRHPETFPFLISTCIPPPPDYERVNLVAASRAHSRLFDPPVPYVHYGINLGSYPFSPNKPEPIIHIAKIAPYKGQHIAVLAAFLARKPLTVAGNVESTRYFNWVMKPLFRLIPSVKYIGEIPGTAQFLKGACALVQTPRWFDVLPLVIIESLACGTPVIAFEQGGISEQIIDGVNGYLCHCFADLVRAMKNVNKLNPCACREVAEKRFHVRRMAEEYEALYARVIKGEKWFARSVNFRNSLS